MSERISDGNELVNIRKQDAGGTDMIQTQTITIGGQEFTKTYSDDNRFVVRDGVSYSEAVDPAEFNRVYTEGDVMPDEEITEEEAGRILMGVDV